METTIKTIGGSIVHPRKTIFDELSGIKLTIIRQMCGPWSCWDLANDAYNALTRKDDKLTDEKRLIEAGVYAERSLCSFNICKELLEKDVDGTIEAMDSTSQWLLNKGWEGLPCPENKNGVRIRKTARQLYDDMNRFKKAKKDFMTAKMKENDK